MLLLLRKIFTRMMRARRQFPPLTSHSPLLQSNSITPHYSTLQSFFHRNLPSTSPTSSTSPSPFLPSPAPPQPLVILATPPLHSAPLSSPRKYHSSSPDPIPVPHCPPTLTNSHRPLSRSSPHRETRSDCGTTVRVPRARWNTSGTTGRRWSAPTTLSFHLALLVPTARSQ